MMDPFSRAYLGMLFKERFTDAQGDEFQKLFGKIMNLRYPGDFTQIRSWGKLGDDKCDGYLPSQKKYYQCYSPDNLAKAKTLSKLKEDFNGALPFKGKYFKTWVFVHNARDGRIPAWLTKELENLRQKHRDISIETLGYIELFQEAFKLDLPQLIDLFGPIPSQTDLLAIQFKDMQPILNHVASQTQPVDTVTRPVPARKLEYNRLSTNVAYCLRQGMIKADVVRNYLDRISDKELATRVTSAFKNEYDRLRQQDDDPDSIFHGLRIFAQGPLIQEPKIEVAILAILSYLFEECDIFERPPEE